MNKLQMAHEYAMKHVQEGFDINYDVLVVEAWKYADAMQAEADKRAVKLPDVFFDTKPNEEWQPDWSQAPEWAGWFSVSKDGSAQWMKSSGGAPYIGGCGSMFFSIGIFKREPCETFNYQGNWQDSLRKRPQ